MQRGRTVSVHLGAPAVASAVVLALVAGCGTTTEIGADLIPTNAHLDGAQACPLAPAPGDAHTLIVLDWDGGVSNQSQDRELAAFAASSLRFADGAGDLPDLERSFRDAVLARVQMILCDLAPMDIAVIEGDADAFPDATAAHVTGDTPPNDGKQIGQSDFDPCNDRADDSAVIWGGALAARIGPGTFDHWVNVFANTTTHEIGHTLGFTHPSEETVARLVPTPSAEIMRANVKPSELRGEQWFLLEQETCPGFAPGEGSYGLNILED